MIDYMVDMEDLTRVEKELEMTRDKSARILVSAINQTAKRAHKLMIDKTLKVYAITKKEVNDAVRTVNAKIKSPVAIIKVKGPMTELYDFKVSPHVYAPHNKPKWYKAKVMRMSPMRRIALMENATGDKYKAFMVRYQSGHITLAQRVPGKRMKSKPDKEFVKTLLSPPVAKMMGGDNGIYSLLEPEIYDILTENIEKQTKKYMQGGGI